MQNELILTERQKLKDAIIAALADFTNNTHLRVDEMKIKTIDVSSDAGKDFLYTDIDFRVSL